MTACLPIHLVDLLTKILSKYKMDASLVALVAKRLPLSDSDLDALIDVIISEFSETGLLQDDEPNARGLQLEELIDWLNSMRQEMR